MTIAPASRQHRLLIAFMPFAFVNGLLSGLRWPTLYTATHWIINYHFGFGKRGLLGAVLEHIDHPPYHFVTLAWMCFVVFGLCVALLFAATWKTLRVSPAVAAALCLYFLSPAFAIFVSDVGRGEQFGLALTLICFLLPNGAAWIAVRSLLALLAVSIHEGNFLIFVPVIAFDAWIRSRSSATRNAAIYVTATAAPATLAAFYFGNAHTACNITQATAYFQGMAADFRLQRLAVASVCFDGPTNFSFTGYFLWSYSARVIQIPLALVCVLPATILNILLSTRIITGGATSTLGLALVTAVPLCLLFFGTDVNRFVTLIQLTSLLALISSARRAPTAERAAPDMSVATIAIIAAFELGSVLNLADSSPMLKFPYVPLVSRLIAISLWHAPFVLQQDY